MARNLTIECLFNESLSYVRERASSLIFPIILMCTLSVMIYISGNGVDARIINETNNDKIFATITEIPFLLTNFFYYLAYLFCYIYVVRDILDVKYFKQDMSIAQRSMVSLTKLPKCLIITGLYVLMVSLGLSFFIFPGLFILWVFYYGVTLSVISDKFYDDFFGKSYKLITENKGFSFIVISLSLALAGGIALAGGVLMIVFGQLGAILNSLAMVLIHIVLAVIPTMGLIYMMNKTPQEERVKTAMTPQESA